MWLIEQFYKWKINRLCRQMYSTGKNIYLTVPFSVSAPELISIGDYSKILGGFTFIGTKGKLGLVIIQRYQLTLQWLLTIILQQLVFLIHSREVCISMIRVKI